MNKICNIKSIISILLLMLSIIYSLSFIFWGESSDLYYWFNRRYFYQHEFMNILSVWLSNIWISLTGNYIVNLKLLGWFLSFMSVLLSYIFFFKKDIMNRLPVLMVSIIMLGYGTYNVYNPDTITFFLLTLILLTTIEYIRNKKNIYIVALIVLCSLAPAARFPNILIIPTVCSIIYFASTSKQLIKSLFFLVFSLLLYLVIVKILSGSNNLFLYIYDGIVNHKVGPSHNIIALIKSYKSSLIISSGYVSLTLLGIFIIRKMYIRFNNTFALSISSIFIFILLKLFCGEGIHGFWNATISLIIYVFTIYKIIHDNSSIDKDGIIAILSLIFIGIIPIAGSDTGLAKLFPFSIISLLYITSKYKREYDFFEKMVILVFIAYSIYMNLPKRKLAKVNFTALENYYIPIESKKDYEDILSKLDVESGEKYVFYGVKKSHALYTITGSKMPYLNSFWMFKNDKNELSNILKIMSASQDFVLVDHTFSDDPQFTNKLKELGYKSDVYDNYIIYRYNGE